MNIKKKMLAVMAALSVGAASWAQEPLRITVWPNGPAEDKCNKAEEKITKEGRVVNSRTAELFVYLPAPEKNTGAAVVICPGGGYARQAMQHEGTMFAQMLVDKGVAGIILKYRLPNGHHAIPLADAQEAMRVVRQHADEWKINPSKVGIAGFSAGGHVASTLGTHCDSTCRPDFMLLFYPVVTMGKLTHAGSRDNLLGDQKNDAALVARYSNELQVSAYYADGDGQTYWYYADGKEVSKIDVKRYGIALFHSYEVSKRTSLYAGVGYDRQEYDDKYDGGKEHLEQDSVQAGIGIVHNF